MASLQYVWRHMRIIRRSLVAVAAIASLAGGVQLVGCGDDDSPSTPGTDGGAEAASSGPVFTVSEARAKIYLGQTAKIDGATLAPGITSNISWSVVAAPSGSAITAATLQGATSASPSFKPDLLGGYTLQISGSKDGVTASVLVFIEAVDAPVFWRQSDVLAIDGGFGSISLSTHAGGIYGGSDRTVSCAPDSGSSSDPNVLGAVVGFGFRFGASAGDVWEAPPGTPSRVVFVEVSAGSGGGVRTSLSVATSQSSCGSPESRELEALTTSAIEAGAETVPPLGSLVQGARFSPSGNRIAYLHDVDFKARLTAIGVDGSAKRELAPFYGLANGAGLDPDAGSSFASQGGQPPVLQLSPRWKDETHVGWITFVGPDATSSLRAEWELYVVEDVAGASPVRVMHCAGSSPSSFDFLPDGTIVAATRHANGNQTPMDLLVYRTSTATGECEVVRNLTNNTKSDAVARDLALSPDKSQIAFFSGTGPGGSLDSSNDLALFVVPADGSRPGTLVPGAGRDANAGIGPRWAAGGTALTWGSVVLLGGQQLSIPAAGGVRRTVVATTVVTRTDGDGGATSAEYRFTYGIGQGCGVSRGPLSIGFMAACGAVGLIALVARRRRRQR